MWTSFPEKGCPPTPWASTWAAVGVIVAGDDGLDLWALVPGDIVGIDRYGNGPPVWLVAWTGRAARCLEAPVPTVCHVLAVVEEQLSSGDLECLVDGCGGVLAPWWYGVERDLVGLNGRVERVRPRRAICRSCSRTRVLLPDTMLRRRQYGVEVIGEALALAAEGWAWSRIAARLGVAYATVRGWLRRMVRRAELVRAWLLGLLGALVDDPWLPAGEQRPLADALVVLEALHRQMPARWPLVARVSRWQLVARLSRSGLLAPPWPLDHLNASRPVT